MTKMNDPSRILANYAPHLVTEWHPTKNGDLTPHDVTFGSNKKVWWICSKCSNEWQATINSRARGLGCPACAGKVVTAWNNLKATNPHLAREWHPMKNELIPEHVVYGSNKKAWWICSKCSYEWETQISHRSRGSGCPACANHVVTKKNNLAVTHPHLAREWNTAKNELQPNSVTHGSHKKVWWKCTACAYEWEAIVNSRSNGNGCPACSNRVVTSWNSLAITHPDLTTEWHPSRNGELTPMNVTFGSTKKVWWKCSKCSHEWESKIYNRSIGRGCPACSSRITTARNNLAITRPHLEQEWHQTKNGELVPAYFTHNSHKKVWWQCSKCNYEWEAPIRKRSNDRCCPRCAMKKA